MFIKVFKKGENVTISAGRRSMTVAVTEYAAIVQAIIEFNTVESDGAIGVEYSDEVHAVLYPPKRKEANT